MNRSVGCRQGDNLTIKEIAEQKMKDLNAVDMDGAVAMIMALPAMV